MTIYSKLEIIMNNENKPVRPVTLVDGDEYLFGERHGTAVEPAWGRVKFIAYCSSPAFVIVNNGQGKARCPRDDMYVRASCGTVCA
jgi:hypothetical protein